MSTSGKVLSEKMDVFRLSFYTAPVSCLALMPFVYWREVRHSHLLQSSAIVLAGFILDGDIYRLSGVVGCPLPFVYWRQVRFGLLYGLFLTERRAFMLTIKIFLPLSQPFYPI